MHLVPSGLLRGAQVSARALVDELGGPAGGHVLVSMFKGDDQIVVDASVGLPGGEKSCRWHPSHCPGQALADPSSLEPDSGRHVRG